MSDANHAPETSVAREAAAEEKEGRLEPSCPAEGALEVIRTLSDAEEELARARTEVAGLQDHLRRLQAEFENYKKRLQREREDVHRQAKERILKELPSVVDNLERAAQHGGGPEGGGEAIVQGVELVLKQLMDIFARYGVTPLTARGAVFDPHLHEAMSRIPTSGDPPDGTVVEEYRRGYLLDGKVLRPALVGVAKLVEEEEGPTA